MWSELASNKSPVHPQNEEYGPAAIQNPLTLGARQLVRVRTVKSCRKHSSSADGFHPSCVNTEVTCTNHVFGRSFKTVQWQCKFQQLLRDKSWALHSLVVQRTIFRF